MTLIQFVVMSCIASRLAVAARSTRLSPLAGLRATGSAVRTCVMLLSALARVVADCATAPQRMLQCLAGLGSLQTNRRQNRLGQDAGKRRDRRPGQYCPVYAQNSVPRAILIHVNKGDEQNLFTCNFWRGP